jgi:hypothetical protein
MNSPLAQPNGCRSARRDNDGHLTTNQFVRQGRQAIVSALCPAILDRQVPALGIAGFPQSIVKRAQTVAKQVGPFGAEHSNHRHRRLLRACRERPRRRRAAKQRKDLAPSNVGHGLLPGTRCASLQQPQHVPEAPRRSLG